MNFSYDSGEYDHLKFSKFKKLCYIPDVSWKQAANALLSGSRIKLLKAWKRPDFSELRLSNAEQNRSLLQTATLFMTSVVNFG
jgi:hypothetical protein